MLDVSQIYCERYSIAGRHALRVRENGVRGRRRSQTVVWTCACVRSHRAGVFSRGRSTPLARRSGPGVRFPYVSR
jgi:hypothetical protein